MSYQIVFSEKALEGLAKIKTSGDKQALKKLNALVEELREHPETGTGKPEKLKGFLSDTWSRRINDKHRLVYTIDNETIFVNISQCYGHYDDK